MTIMDYNISTNILRDESKKLNYVVTPNTTKIFKRIFGNNDTSNRSFTLIGNYGTGKSTFLWALERNLLKEEIFFGNHFNEKLNSFEFLKIIGGTDSLISSLQNALNLKKESSIQDILIELEIKRVNADIKNNGFVILIDEFGKFLEGINKKGNNNDLYLLQLISEWVNDSNNNSYFIITLHQNFISYSSSLDIIEKQEWEKIKGRFIEILFNEPIEQLLYFASKQLNEFQIPKKLITDFSELNDLIKKSGLVNFSESSKNLAESLYPLEWLSANILVNALQRYGQNERSLFTFLSEKNENSIYLFKENFYTVSNVFDYLAITLSGDIYNYSNPHRPQWLIALRSLERAEVYFQDDFIIAAEIIKTICLVNIFCKAGGNFDEDFIVSYFETTRGVEISMTSGIIEKLKKTGIIRFYKHRNKYNFLDGTDIDIEQELATISKEINDFSISEEISKHIVFPIISAKKHSYEKGSQRFFEYRVLNNLDEIKQPQRSLDGYVNLIFNSDIKDKDVLIASKNSGCNLFVLYKNSKDIHNKIFSINKFNLLIEKFGDDVNALTLLKQEREYNIENLKNLVLENLFVNQKENIWIDNGAKIEIQSKRQLNEILSVICDRIYYKAPIFRNELANKETLSGPINAARKSLIRYVLQFENEEGLGFSESKFPPEKSIYRSLLLESGIHSKNRINQFEFGKASNISFHPLWDECEDFLKSAKSSKRNLAELYEILSEPPFKLKKGFVEFWIPLFLIFKKEDFALFHNANGFVPYLKEDVLDLLHKNPQNYLVKSYDVSGLNVNLLESYKEIVHVENQKLGSKSTFLSIFGNFIRFYRGLNDYSINTKKLSEKTINLRNAIKNAQDPEEALFSQFPSALGFHSLSIKDDEKALKAYTSHIYDAIREMRSAYDNLLERIELNIKHSFQCENLDFNDYKKAIVKRLENVNINLLGKEQEIFYKRIFSPLDDKSSWLKSIADAALGKSIDKLIDEEEILLMNNIKAFSLGLIKASDIHSFNNVNNDKLVLFEFVGASGDIVSDRLVIVNNPGKDYLNLKTELKQNLSKLDSDKRRQILLDLLSLELNNMALYE